MSDLLRSKRVEPAGLLWVFRMSPAGLGLDFNFRLTRFSVCARGKPAEVRGEEEGWFVLVRVVPEWSND